MKRGISVFGLFLICAIIGCGNPATTEPGRENSAEPIRWFEGDVEAAFAEAKELGKPIFLYWGAVWCPPCHNLKINYFTKPEFIQSMKQFVPVYLDGDTDRAQLWAERYGITGYPTVILFAPTGVEVYRMPSDVTAERYGDLLEAVIADIRPVRQVFEDVMAAGPENSRPIDLQLIAFHSWVQDPHSDLSKTEALESFWKLYSATPSTSGRLRARFMTLALEQAVQTAWSSAPGSVEDPYATLSGTQQEALRTGLLELLNDPNLWADNKIFLTLQARRVINLLESSPASNRDELVTAWITAAEGMQVHPEFSATEQLMAFVPEFELTASDAGEPSAVSLELQNKVRTRVEEMTSGPHDPGEFQSTLNMLAWLLTMARLPEEAKTLLDQHMEQTAAPHYFLSLLGDLEADNPETALEWHRLAFETAESVASKVKWGSAYLLRLVQMSPENVPAIDAASRELIAILASADDAFAGRNYPSLQRIDQSLTAWAEATGNKDTIASLRLEVLEQCERFKGSMDPTQYERCMDFLADEASEPVSRTP